MSNLVLYRKYRPKSFKEVVGQEHVVKTLTNALADNAISHAYLFAGPRGSGKTTIARLLAKSANCRERKEGQAEPCNKCSSCQDIQLSRSMDLIEIDAASHRGIDEIRELKENVKFSPVKEKYKVFILDEAHQLSKDAANALLKTLEEPPSHAIFILATTEAYKMIPTIISRCQKFDFKKLSAKEITGRLEDLAGQEKAKIEKEALEFIALNSSGSVRDAESLLDQVLVFSGASKGITLNEVKNLLGMADIQTISLIVDYLSQKNLKEGIEVLNQTIEQGKDPQELARGLVRYLRQALILKIDPREGNPVILGLAKEEKAKLLSQVQVFTQQELQKSLNSFLIAENKMKYSSIPQLPLELALVEILSA